MLSPRILAVAIAASAAIAVAGCAPGGAVRTETTESGYVILVLSQRGEAFPTAQIPGTLDWSPGRCLVVTQGEVPYLLVLPPGSSVSNEGVITIDGQQFAADDTVEWGGGYVTAAGQHATSSNVPDWVDVIPTECLTDEVAIVNPLDVSD